MMQKRRVGSVLGPTNGGGVTSGKSTEWWGNTRPTTLFTKLCHGKRLNDAFPE